MARIIVYGDIDKKPLYLNLNGTKEYKIRGHKPCSIAIRAGKHKITATTITKRKIDILNSYREIFGIKAYKTLKNHTDAAVSGEIEVDMDNILLIRVERVKKTTKITNRVIFRSELSEYLDVCDIEDFPKKTVRT